MGKANPFWLISLETSSKQPPRFWNIWNEGFDPTVQFLKADLFCLNGLPGKTRWIRCCFFSSPHLLHYHLQPTGASDFSRAYWGVLSIRDFCPYHGRKICWLTKSSTFHKFAVLLGCRNANNVKYRTPTRWHVMFFQGLWNVTICIGWIMFRYPTTFFRFTRNHLTTSFSNPNWKKVFYLIVVI